MIEGKKQEERLQENKSKINDKRTKKILGENIKEVAAIKVS